MSIRPYPSLAFRPDRDSPHPCCLLAHQVKTSRTDRSVFKQKQQREMSISSIIGMVRIIANQPAGPEEDGATDVVVGIPVFIRKHLDDHPGVFAPVIRKSGLFHRRPRGCWWTTGRQNR